MAVGRGRRESHGVFKLKILDTLCQFSHICGAPGAAGKSRRRLHSAYFKRPPPPQFFVLLMFAASGSPRVSQEGGWGGACCWIPRCEYATVVYVSQEVCLPIPEGSGKLACYLTGLHAETGRERETSERTNSEQNNRERRSDLCACVCGGGEGGRPWILAAATSVSAAVLMIFLFFYLLPLRSNWTKDLGNRRPFAAWGVNMETL